MSLTTFKKKISIKYFMVAYGAFLLAFSSLYKFHDSERLLKGLIMVAVYCALDVAWTRAREKTWYIPISSIISGFILSLVAMPSPSFALIILLPLIAVASKHLLRFGKMRHLYNPAAFSMAIVGFFVSFITWWGVAWGNPLPLLVIIVVAGIFITWRQDRFHMVLAFLLSYSVFLGIFFLFTGTSPTTIPGILKTQIIDGTTLFFATVMLIEPLTSTFPTKKQRVLYGIMVAFFAVVLSYLGSFIDIPGPLDPLVYGLCLGNLTAGLLFLKSKPSAKLTSA